MTNEGCNSTAAWINSAFASSTTTLAEKNTKVQISPFFFQAIKWYIIYNVRTINQTCFQIKNKEIFYRGVWCYRLIVKLRKYTKPKMSSLTSNGFCTRVLVWEWRINQKYSPPQQKPAAPTAETPLLFTASITGFASSNPLSYWNNDTVSETTSAYWKLHKN